MGRGKDASGAERGRRKCVAAQGHGGAQCRVSAAARSGVLAAGLGLGRGVLARPVGGRHPVGGGVPQTVKARRASGGAPVAGDLRSGGGDPALSPGGRGAERSLRRAHPRTPAASRPARRAGLTGSAAASRSPQERLAVGQPRGQARGPLLGRRWSSESSALCVCTGSLRLRADGGCSLDECQRRETGVCGAVQPFPRAWHTAARTAR